MTSYINLSPEVDVLAFATVGQFPPIGADGVLYLDESTATTYFWTGAAYAATGTQGPPGAPGSFWYSGSGIPANTLGNDGDLYLDSVTGNVYQKQNGAWL